MVRKTVTREKAYELLSKFMDKYAEEVLKEINTLEIDKPKDVEMLTRHVIMHTSWFIGARDAFEVLYGSGSKENMGIIVITNKIVKHIVDHSLSIVKEAGYEPIDLQSDSDD